MEFSVRIIVGGIATGIGGALGFYSGGLAGVKTGGAAGFALGSSIAAWMEPTDAEANAKLRDRMINIAINSLVLVAGYYCIQKSVDLGSYNIQLFNNVCTSSKQNLLCFNHSLVSVGLTALQFAMGYEFFKAFVRFINVDSNLLGQRV